MISDSPIRWTDPTIVAVDVLRMGGVRPSWLGEARVELVPTPKSRWLAHSGGLY